MDPLSSTPCILSTLSLALKPIERGILTSPIRGFPMRVYYVAGCDRWGSENHPCRCLCLGFLEHIIYILPFRLTTAHPSHILFTDDRTFMPLAMNGVASVAEGNMRCG